MKRIKTLVVLLLFLVMAICPGYGLSLQPGQTIQLSKRSYSLEDLLKKLETIPTIKISYDSGALSLDVIVVVEKTDPTLAELISYIGKTGMVEAVVNDSYLVFKQKKIERKYRVTGVVTDSENREPVPGVNVYIKGTSQGVVTNSDGEYSLTIAPGSSTLVFSFIGYVTQETDIKMLSDQTLNIQLVLQKTELTEIKITAQRKFFGNMEYGREIPTIKAEVIGKQNANNASDILHASVAGVWATKTSGAPGDHQKIRIRGQNSLFTSAEPLYVIDGVPVPIVNLSSLGIGDLNIHDIENVTVLKDASSTALYGFQGGNGVVLIDTKQGGKNEISFSTKFGYQWLDNFYDLMTSEEQIASFDSAYPKIQSYLKYRYPKFSNSLCSRDWQKEIFSPGSIQEYQLSASGLKGMYKYYFSGNYTDHKGILPNSEYKRYSLSARIGRSFGEKFVFNLAYRGSKQENKNNQDEYKGNPLIYVGISTSPCLECTPDSLIYDDRGSPYIRSYTGRVNITTLPQSIVERNTNSLNTFVHAINGQARFQITDNLSMDFMESYMYHHTDYYLNSNVFDHLKSREEVILINHQLNLSYNNSFGKHNVGAVLAFRNYTDNLWWNVDSLNSKLPENYLLKNSMAAYGLKGSVLRKMTSYIGHFSYNFRKTYFLSAVANLSKVKDGLYTNYYQLFPSIALSWDLAQEKPFRGIHWLNQFNLYTNWGISGNYPLSGLSNDLYEDVFAISNRSIQYYPVVKQFANHNLRHESTSEMDFGLKSSFFKNRISFSAAYFDKKINNLIIQRDIPSYYGGGKMYLNVGAISVNGIELGIEITPIETKNFTWCNQFNFSKSSQKVTRLYNHEDVWFIDGDMLMPEFIIKEGESIGNIYGYKTAGKWTTADRQSGSRKYLNKYGTRFLNADSTNWLLDNNDKVVIGNSIPDYTWNLSNTFQFKNIRIDMVWYAAIGADKYNGTRAVTIMTGTNNEVNDFINDSLKLIRSDLFYESAEFIEDASFIKLKTISVSYDLPKKLYNTVQCSFTLSFENLLTFTHYKGYDPEATIFTDNNFSDNAVDLGSYPNPKSVFATILFKF